jgi:flagellar hook-associated protein 1 FlgK
MSIYSVATSALQSAQVAIATVGHNIANVNTDGYRRQEVILGTNGATRTGSGFLGQGVNVNTVQRVYSELLERQVSRSEAQAGYLDQYLQGMQQINNILGDRSVGFSSMVQAFFASWNDLADDASSISARQAVLGTAETLANNLHGVGDYLQSLQDSVNADITSIVGQINGYAQNIAQLNSQIANGQTSDTQAPNDLLDQRDLLVSQLNELSGVTVVKDAATNGYNVFLGNGYLLVGGMTASSITAQSSLYDPARMEVFDANGGVLLSREVGSLGGKLGGLLDYRSESLDVAQNSLGRLAIALSQSVNDQHQLGQDLNGTAGGLFFSDPSAFAQTFASSVNAGNGAIDATIDDASALTTSDYRLSYDGATYTLTRSSDGQAWSNASLATLSTTADQGFTLSLASGAVSAGDSYLIRPTVAGSTSVSVAISDPEAIAAASPIAAAAATANTGTAQFTQPTVDTASQPPLNANLTSAVTITFTSATTFDVSGTGTGNPTGLTYTAGGDISYNGWTFQITGTPATGDVFTISANTGGELDNRNALAMAALQNDKTLVGGSASLEGAYAALVGSIGNKTSQVEVNQKAQTNLLTQAQQAQQSVSGVNLDEEAANLLRYQQAYQAAARLITTAQTMFDTILQIG